MKDKHYFADRVVNGALRPIDMKSGRGRITYAVLTLIILIHLCIVIIPVLWMFMLCFKSPEEIYSNVPSFFPKVFSFAKIKNTWCELEIYKYYMNTIIMGLGCVVFDITVCGLAGYSISRLKPKGGRGYFALISLMMLMPATCAMVPNYMLFKNLNLLNTFFPVWLLAGTNIFNILLFKTSFDGISTSLIEAANIDGASVLRIFIKIMIPLSIPVIATCAIFTFNGSFGNFFWPYLTIQTEQMKTMAVRLYELKNSAALTMDKQMLTAIFSIIPQVVVFIVFQKYIMGGINVGGVKG